jgi:predicted nuclease with TOPRIM domain
MGYFNSLREKEMSEENEELRKRVEELEENKYSVLQTQNYSLTSENLELKRRVKVLSEDCEWLLGFAPAWLEGLEGDTIDPIVERLEKIRAMVLDPERQSSTEY